jgi:hypothetical protein
MWEKNMKSELDLTVFDFLRRQLQTQVAQPVDIVLACLKNVHETLLKVEA